MKRAIAIGTMLAFVASQALAAAAPSCDGTAKLSGNQLTTMLPGKYVCVGAYPNAVWNEKHVGTASGTIVDYKKGPGDLVDPEGPVGSYSISGGTGAGQVTYDYGGGTMFSFYAKLVSPSVSSASYPLLFCPMPSGMPLAVTVSTNHC